MCPPNQIFTNIFVHCDTCSICTLLDVLDTEVSYLGSIYDDVKTLLQGLLQYILT